MINSIDNYLGQLKKELNGCDRATIQDALADAEEYLRSAFESLKQQNASLKEDDVMEKLVHEYGSPQEIAVAYKRVESRFSPSLTPITQTLKKNIFSRFFGVVIDPKAWGAYFYLLFSLVTGIIYFTWVVTGISLSAGLMVLIIGLPIAGVFLLSFRGLALVEGRLVEALLDIRMPRRAVFSDKSMSLWNRFKSWVKDTYTWLSILYLILMLPLGVIYFSVFLTLLVVSLALIASPILQLGFGLPLFTSFDVQYFLPGWLLLMSVIGGSLLFFVMLHLAKLVGKLHGTMAKYMLVRES